MQMKIVVAGIYNRSGISQKTQRPYDIHSLIVLEPVKLEGTIVNGAGYVAREMDCNAQVMSQLSQVKFPAEVEGFFSMRNDNKLQCDSVRVPAALAKAG